MPARAQHAVEGGRREQLVDGSRRHAVNSRAQRLVGNKLVGHMIRRDVDANGLPVRTGDGHRQGQAAQEGKCVSDGRELKLEYRATE